MDDLSMRAFAKLDGCSEGLVRRGVKEGRLKTNADGKLDAGLVGSGWRRGNVGVAPSVRTEGTRSAQAEFPVRRPDESIEDAAARVAAASAQIPDYADSLAKKEHFLSLLRELEFREKSAALVDVKLAERVLFEEFRGARDAWQNFPAKSAALIAADLGVEADRVTEVLTAHVHKQLAALGEPAGRFTD